MKEEEAVFEELEKKINSKKDSKGEANPKKQVKNKK